MTGFGPVFLDLRFASHVGDNGRVAFAIARAPARSRRRPLDGAVVHVRVEPRSKPRAFGGAHCLVSSLFGALAASLGFCQALRSRHSSHAAATAATWTSSRRSSWSVSGLARHLCSLTACASSPTSSERIANHSIDWWLCSPHFMSCLTRSARMSAKQRGALTRVILLLWFIAAPSLGARPWL